MRMLIFKKNIKAFAIIMILCLFLSQFIFLPTYALESQVELLITGTGIYEEVIITENDWQNYDMIEQTYSVNNSLNFHKIIKTKGYDLFELIGKSNLKSDQNYNILFVCSDGFQFTKSIEELKKLYFFSDFTENTKIASQPMLAFYSAVLADFPKDRFNPPISWTDLSLTESNLDPDSPKLVFGQTDIDDMNLSKWGKKVVKIVVGEEIAGKPETNSPYKHISYDGAPYNVDTISGATFTIEGPALEGYRAISLRQIQEDIDGQSIDTYYEKSADKIIQNTYEGINVKYLIDHYVKINTTPGRVIFKNKSRQTILSIPYEDIEQYKIAYGINEVPLVYLDSDVGYRPDKQNDNGCFKLVYPQEENAAIEFSNVAYIYVEEKDASNISEHSYPPFNNFKYTDYEIIIHGDGLGQEVRFSVTDIENMVDIQFEAEYSLSNSEYFWYFNKYKGVTLWDLLIKSGLNPHIDESTSIQFIAADHYNFPPMTIGEIKDASRYHYYEKSPEDLGDGKYDGTNVAPLHTHMPVLVAYGFNGYPYVIRPTDEGFNAGLGNDGGPLRIIFGKTNYNDVNGSNQVQFIKEIIIGGGESISSTIVEENGDGENTHQSVNKDITWNHNQGVYKDYLDDPILRVTGSQVKNPMTFTLRQIESMLNHSIKDVYTGDGISEYEGIILWQLVSEMVGIKDGVEIPSFRVFSGPNYNQILRSFDQISKGVTNSKGENKQIILAYAKEGYPLVPNESSIGYSNNNAYGPLRLLVEESKSMWVKWVDCIVVGTGDYEAPKLEDVVALDLPTLPSAENYKQNPKIWLDFKNNTGKEMVEASVRSMEYDNQGNLWIGTNNGGLSIRTTEGHWQHIDEITTSEGNTIKIDTTYAIVQRENGELWMTSGGPTEPKGILVKKNDVWIQYRSDNSNLPACYVQEFELDGNQGLWIGTNNGVVHVDHENNWQVYTVEEGLLPYSVDALEPDGKGGIWVGYYPDIVNNNDGTTSYFGGYQHIHFDGKIDTFQDFDNSNFNLNWIRSISMDSKGGVWIVRSGNAIGYGQGEIDYVLGDEQTVYQAKDLIPEIPLEDDIRLLLTDPYNDDVFYIATLKNGLLKSEGVGNITQRYNSSNVFSSNQWNNIYFLDWNNQDLMMGTNGGAAIQTTISTFQDVATHWAKNDVEKMNTLGYIKGYNGKFRPDESITRAEFITMLVNVIGFDKRSPKNDFNDVTADAWFAPYISTAVENHLVNGYEDGTFRPNHPISREEICAVLSRVTNKELEVENIEQILSKFNDPVSNWAKIYIAKAVASDFLIGFPDGRFGGNEYATRAQSAVMLLRFLSH